MYVTCIYWAGGPYGKKLCLRSCARNKGHSFKTKGKVFSHVDRPRLVDAFFIFSAVLPFSMLVHGKNSIYHEKNTMVSVVNIDSYEP